VRFVPPSGERAEAAQFHPSAMCQRIGDPVEHRQHD
jgi:hypothetical protein